MRILLTTIFLVTFSLLYAQQESPDVRRGNRQYNDSNYVEAEVNYRRGLEKNNESFEGHFNLGDALFRQQKYQEAVGQYKKAETLLKRDIGLDAGEIDKYLAATYHNMGNAFYAQEQYAEAIKEYEQSLRHNPKDNDTRYNLVKAKQQLKRQQNQQQNQNQNHQDKQEKQQQNQQQNQDQNQQDKQKHPQQDQQGQQQPDQMDKETAEQILQALEQDEQATQEKMQRQQGKKRQVEKEW